MMKTQKNTMVSIGRFIDPLTDFGFKRIFGSEPNKDLLIAFLNELFKGRKVIRSLEYNPQESSIPSKHYRKSIFDLTCTGADGEIFIIEMQRAEQKYFTDRAVFYTSCKMQEQAPKGKKNWDYKLPEVYFIGLMDFNFDQTPPHKYLHRVRLAEEETSHTFYNKLGFIFIELPNFNLGEKDIKTDLERWMYVLRNMSKLEKIPVILHKKIFQKLFQIAEVSNLKKEEYMQYEKNILDKWTEYSVLKTAEERGREEGMEKGIEKGKTEGKAEEVHNLISKLGLSDAQAADVAEVTVAFVKKVRASVKGKSKK